MTAGLTAPEPAASRRELEEVRGWVRHLDDHGTRGVGAIQGQLTEVIKDLARFQAATEGKFRDHARQHAEEARARVSGRRWAFGMAVTGLATAAAVVGLLLDILSHLGRR